MDLKRPIQQRLIDPYTGDPHAERSRAAEPIRRESAEQEVLRLLVAVDGGMPDGRLLHRAMEGGVTPEEVSEAVTTLEARGTIGVDEGWIRLRTA